MIKIPYEQIVEKITSNSELSADEVERRVKKKMDQLSGLISKEGAAHIIANELNIQLYNQFSGRLQIKNVLPGLRNIEVLGRVSSVYAVKEFKVGEREGKVGSFNIQDETGRIRVVLWGAIADQIKTIKEGDIVKITAAYSRESNGFKEVHANDRSAIEVNPKGEIVEDITPAAPRKNISDLNEGDNVEILGTIVDLFEPKFFEICAECGKRVKNDAMKCEKHPEAGINYSYVLNAFLDDGTDNIRVVFFRDQASDLLAKNAEEMAVIRTSPESFSEIKKGFLGSMLKVNGRAIKNQMFERLEFIANSIDKNPDPKEEAKRLNK